MSVDKSDLVMTSTIEDYLEAILVLSHDKGYAQVTEIAQLLEISKASVTEMVSKLKNNGLVNYEKYGTITLTVEGNKIAENVKERHDIFKLFLLIIGVKEETAETDCCVMEHNLSTDTINKLKDFIKFLNKDDQKEFIERFKEFSKNQN